MSLADEVVVDFPTLFVVPAWIEAHCPIPDGFQVGKPFRLYPWQLWCTINHYRVKPTAIWVPEKPVLAPAFHNRRSQFVGPQKTGKSPLAAAIICNEAVGPALFAGWALEGDRYQCIDHGCGCGWVYEYQPGEPMGMPWATAVIQILGPSEANTSNVYTPLKGMIKGGPLADLMRVTETDIALPNGGSIEPVTSSAQSRIGNPITFAIQEETGWYTVKNKLIKVAETQGRGLGGMSGRSIENTNPWDPTEKSLAQKTFDAKVDDIFRFYRLPPLGLDYADPLQRRLIHAFNYEGCEHSDLDSIEGWAAELAAGDQAQAERFYGNRAVVGNTVAFNIEKWLDNARPDTKVAQRSLIVVGIDGARFEDSLAIVATDVATGFQWPVIILTRPDDADDDYEHDFERADGAMLELFKLYRVWRCYIDPQRIEKLVERWQGRWKSKIIEWHMNRPRQVCWAVRQYQVAIGAGDCLNDGDELMAAHIGNARRRTETVKDDEGKPMFSIQKEFPGSPLKIDAAAAGVISWECRGDAIAAGVNTRRSSGRVWDG